MLIFDGDREPLCEPNIICFTCLELHLDQKFARGEGFLKPPTPGNFGVLFIGKACYLKQVFCIAYSVVGLAK